MNRTILKFTNDILREKVSSYCLATGYEADEDMELRKHTEPKAYQINGSSDAMKHSAISDAISMYIGINGLMLDRPNVFIVGTLNNSNLTLIGYEAVHSVIEATVG